MQGAHITHSTRKAHVRRTSHHLTRCPSSSPASCYYWQKLQNWRITGKATKCITITCVCVCVCVRACVLTLCPVFAQVQPYVHTHSDATVMDRYVIALSAQVQNWCITGKAT